jgi:hypothetical protein
MSVALKSALIAGGLAFLVNTPFIPVFLLTGISYQWFFVWPLMDFAGNYTQTPWLFFLLFYASGFLQFFVLFWIIIWLKFRYGKSAA